MCWAENKIKWNRRIWVTPKHQVLVEEHCGPASCFWGRNWVFLRDGRRDHAEERMKWITKIKLPVADTRRSLIKNRNLLLPHMLLLFLTVMGSAPCKDAARNTLLWGRAMLQINTSCLYIPVLMPFPQETVSFSTYHSRQKYKKEPS